MVILGTKMLAVAVGATTLSAAGLATASSWIGIASGATATVVSLGIIANGVRTRRKLPTITPPCPPTPPQHGASEDEWSDYEIRLDQFYKDHGWSK